MWDMALKGLTRGVLVGIVVGAVVLPLLALVYVRVFSDGWVIWPSNLEILIRGAFFGVIGGVVFGAPVGIVSGCVIYLVRENKGEEVSADERKA